MASAVLVSPSMGCRVVVEAAVQAPDHTAGVVLVDGSQFAATSSLHTPSIRIEIIPNTGHFPQIDETERTNALLDGCGATSPAR
jgi:pimeloyl-ACP methyl ester carboxylesterase